jgi:hypothetical protein
VCTRGAQFFSSAEGGRVVDFLNFFCSHYVPQVLIILNNTSLYPLSFALSSTLLTSMSSPKGGEYLFWDCPKVDHFSFFWGDGAINDGQGKKLNFGGRHN